MSLKKMGFQISEMSGICVRVTLDHSTSHRNSPEHFSGSLRHQEERHSHLAGVLREVKCRALGHTAWITIEKDPGLLTPGSPHLRHRPKRHTVT